MIGEGDLVEVVRWPCCGKHVGVRRVVSSVLFHPEGWDLECGSCGRVSMDVGTIGTDASIPQGQGLCARFPLAWVRKVPPARERPRALVLDDFEGGM